MILLLLLPRWGKGSFGKSTNVLQRWKKHSLEGFVGKYHIIFLQKRSSIYVGWGGKWFQISIFHKLLLPWGVCYTHTHTPLFFWRKFVWFCTIFAKFKIFSLSTNQWSFGEKRPKSPSKKSSFTYTWAKLVAKNIYMDVWFFPSYF